MRTFALFLTLTATLALAAPARPSPSPSAEEKRQQALFAEAWEWQLRDDPTFATTVGDPRYNHLLPDLSPTAVAARRQQPRTLLTRIQRIDRRKLSAAEQLNHDLFLYAAQEGVEEARFPGHLLVLNQLGGPHQILADVAQDMPRATVKDWEDLLARMRALPRYLEQATALLREGTRTGVTPPRAVLGRLPAQIATQLHDDPTQVPVYKMAFDNFPLSVPTAEAERLRSEAKKALVEAVLPALKAFHTFVENEYVPNTRTTLAASDLPEGAAWYALRVKVNTSLDWSAERIHQKGLEEVARLRGEQERLQKAMGFEGTRSEFFNFMRSDKRFLFTSREEMVTQYRALAKRIDPQLARLFLNLPRLTYGVDPMPAHAEKTAPAAYYQPGAPQTGRPGLFHVNTYNLPSRPRWEIEALTLHEAVPGHHLQIATAQELEVPMFRKWGDHNAYVEGWGLYAESLGAELGLYTDLSMQFGRVTFEMWRAVRLVVDTGLHAKGWTRDQAIAYFREAAGKSDHDIAVEVDRYITWPGQALGYKMGELKLRELRALAEAELGKAFDIRAFHHEVLRVGPVPLAVLEAHLRAWLRRTRPA